jgi:hypothetical protein
MKSFFQPIGLETFALASSLTDLCGMIG